MLSMGRMKALKNSLFMAVGNNACFGLNFINVLLPAFTLTDPKSVRTQSSRQYLFTLLGSAHIKAIRRALMKLTPSLLSEI